MEIDALRSAITTGHKSSAVLADVLRELADFHYCPDAVGNEGRDTFPDCQSCVYCCARKMQDSGEI